MTFNVSAPSWVNQSINRRGDQLRLNGNSSWRGQPVVNTLSVTLSDEITGVKFNQMMQASYRIQGTTGRNRVVFGDQAGSITKRLRSVIDFGRDEVKDVFSFSNAAPGKPFNHMQRIRLQNFGKEDVILLKNVGRRISFGDLQRGSNGAFVVPGVNQLWLEVLA